MQNFLTVVFKIGINAEHNFVLFAPYPWPRVKMFVKSLPMFQQAPLNWPPLVFFVAGIKITTVKVPEPVLICFYWSMFPIFNPINYNSLFINS